MTPNNAPEPTSAGRCGLFDSVGFVFMGLLRLNLEPEKHRSICPRRQVGAGLDGEQQGRRSGHVPVCKIAERTFGGIGAIGPQRSGREGVIGRHQNIKQRIGRVSDDLSLNRVRGKTVRVGGVRPSVDFVSTDVGADGWGPCQLDAW